ncbi:hypothetical protein [Duganella callida]|uniref:Uncharacterized protein n=1 Tax=Duganella callida TaxID=2561932 RepID=A0A4Y9S956_9BURK|nr:hypothetical protein [Duganella callida]TFW17972.1 hypothetical protein E4L98_19190 [Duganella callida]
MQTRSKRTFPTKAKEQKSRFTPLGIIAAFLGVTEVAMGYTITNTTGQVQLLLTYFAIGFPPVIFVGFFVLSYFKPEALLAQPDFATATEATEYLIALRGFVQKAEVEATNIFASAEEMKALAAQTKISLDTTEDLRVKLTEQVKQLEDIALVAQNAQTGANLYMARNHGGL